MFGQHLVISHFAKILNAAKIQVGPRFVILGTHTLASRDTHTTDTHDRHGSASHGHANYLHG